MISHLPNCLQSIGRIEQILNESVRPREFVIPCRLKQKKIETSENCSSNLIIGNAYLFQVHLYHGDNIWFKSCTIQIKD